MQLIDIGVNLTNPSLQKDLPALISQAKSAGVVHQIITGTSISSSQQALELSKTDPDYFSCTAGCHPHDAKDFKSDDDKLLFEMSKNASVVAIGECGLDFNRNYSPQTVQEQVFELQIELSSKVKLPLFMHQRDAHQRFIEILSNYKNHFSSGVLHCYTGDQQQLKDCLDLGLYIGITGWICDERRGQELQKALRYIPLDRIMVETDSPYLLPRNIQPKPKIRTNTPANLPWVVNKISELLNTTVELVADQATANTKRFFALTI